jgi:hypothetical protein
VQYRLVRLLIVLFAFGSFAFAPVAQAMLVYDAGTDLAQGGMLDLHNIPSWVQVVTSTATLYSADTGTTPVGPKVLRFTFLRVLGGAHERLQVEAVTETGDTGQRGWIDPDVVLPSAPGQGWLVTATATTLFHDDAAARTIAQFKPLQQIDGPVQGRIEVRLYSDDLLSVVDRGWVDQAATGPAYAPATRVPDPNAPRLPAKSSSDPWAFVDAAAGAAITARTQTGVPASVTVAQAILESDWGRSALAQTANNYFGIKAVGSLGNDGVVWMSTGEFDASGMSYMTTSPFRAYKSLTDSLIDHDLMLQGSKRYADAMKVANDPRAFAEQLAQAGYATDPDYASKLIALMDRYDLYRLDSVA